MLHQAEHRPAGAFVKARLHHPNFAHIGGELAAPAHITDASLKNLIDRLLQRWKRMRASRLLLGPKLTHITPQNASQQVAGAHAFLGCNTPIRIFQGGFDQRLIASLHDDIKQGIDALRQTDFAQSLDAGRAMAGLQQFEHFIKHPALRHFFQQTQHFSQWFGRFGLDFEAA